MQSLSLQVPACLQTVASLLCVALLASGITTLPSSRKEYPLNIWSTLTCSTRTPPSFGIYKGKWLFTYIYMCVGIYTISTKRQSRTLDMQTCLKCWDYWRPTSNGSSTMKVLTCYMRKLVRKYLYVCSLCRVPLTQLHAGKRQPILLVVQTMPEGWTLC